ncbi:AGAP013221-PA-like protein [Anopheles sinensis]|uniref:AGAP013221-PA-like protein n=1 Tax=Anopheles sinensis TaxID=74873 RepID=A0A084VW05_ANOSI|nr:AGAP013221-PA-like protein [Anopheles sinensis]
MEGISPHPLVILFQDSTVVGKMFLRKSRSFSTVILVIAVFLCSAVAGKRISELKCDKYKEIISIRGAVLNTSSKPTVVYFEGKNCSNLIDLISGGKEAMYGEFPHHAILGYRQDDGSYSFKCGGSLISDQFILTAAHCFKFEYPTLVRLGEYDLAVNSSNKVDLGIKKIIRHPNNVHVKAYHDIALIQLNETVRFSKFIRPACLWTEPVLNTTSFIATGFGMLDNYALQYSTHLMKVKLDLFPSKDCQRIYATLSKHSYGISDGQLCVGSIVGGKDTCQGDSGGPLQIITEPGSCIYNIVGVTSTGLACGIGNAKAIYTNVAHYLDWIEQTVWPENVVNKTDWNTQ